MESSNKTINHPLSETQAATILAGIKDKGKQKGKETDGTLPPLPKAEGRPRKRGHRKNKKKIQKEENQLGDDNPTASTNTNTTNVECHQCTGHASTSVGTQVTQQDETGSEHACRSTTTTPSNPSSGPIPEAKGTSRKSKKAKQSEHDAERPCKAPTSANTDSPKPAKGSRGTHLRRGSRDRTTSKGSPIRKPEQDWTLSKRRYLSSRTNFEAKIWSCISQPGVRNLMPRPTDDFMGRIWSTIRNPSPQPEIEFKIPHTPPMPSYGEYLDELIAKINVDEKEKDLNPELYERKLMLLRARLAGKLRESLAQPYTDNILCLLNHVDFTATHLQFINSRDKPYYDDENTYPGQEIWYTNSTPSQYCTGVFRQGPLQNHKTSQRVPGLITAVIDGHRSMYNNLIIGNGRVNNAHLHTSILKRYMSCLVKHYQYDAYSLTGQNWLSNVKDGGNVLLTGAFINKTLEDEWPRLAKAKIPIMAVIQHYTPGVHIGNELSYICNNEGYVLGTSNEGKHAFWTDKNIDIPYSGDWHGMNITTLMELGPQRLIFINHEEPTPTTFRPWGRPDKMFKCKSIRPITVGNSHMMVGLDKDETEEPPKMKTIVGWNPFLIYQSYTENARLPIWRRFKRYVRKIWRNSRTYDAYKYFAELLGIFPDEYQIIINPNLCQFPIEDDMLNQLYYSNPIDPITSLPYGMYRVTPNAIIQLHYGDNSANWTNLWTLFQAYSVRKGNSQASIYRDLVDKTCALHPFIVPNTENAFQPPFESPLDPILARRPYKIQVFEKPGFAVAIFSEQELREYVVNYVTRKSVSAAASWRVVRAGLRNVMPMGTLLQEYVDFWYQAVCHLGEDHMIHWDDLPDISHFTGRKRRKYQHIFDNLGTWSDRAHYKLFCKMEALPLSSVLKKAVRIISPNNPVFNVVVLNFFLAFEEKLLRTRSHMGTPFFAKGLNYELRYETIKFLAARFNYCYSIDFKNFDAHHCDDNYKQEINFYILIGLLDKYGRQLLTARHTGVITYEAYMRCSGDLFTGSGNCLTVGALLWPFVGDDFMFFCDGDDTLIFLNHQSHYDALKQHLYDRGYELGDPEIIKIVKLAQDRYEYAIPFCQVEYHWFYYTKDLDRLLNKCGNLAGANLDVVAKAFLGKLQSFSILSAHGTMFNIDIGKFLVGLDDNYETDYKKMMIANLQHYEPYMARSIDLINGTSLVAQVARKFEENSSRIFRTFISNRPKLLVRLIKEVLQQELNAQMARNPTEEALTKKVTAFVEREGFQAMVPVLSNIYREMVRDYTDWTILPPRTPTTNTTLVYAHGQMYT